MRTEELIEQLRDREIMIYGAGFVADSFWYALQKHGLTDQVRCFAVSVPEEEKREFHGRPVIGREELQRGGRDGGSGALICLAVHAAIADRLLEELTEAGIRNIVWIYPNLHELLYGAPLQENVPMPCSLLLSKQDRDNSCISLRYLAARACIEQGTDPEHSRGGDDQDARELYLAGMAFHSGPDTARKRLQRLRQLTDSMMQRGWDPSCPILIDETGRVIDGLHRLACACALGLQQISCSIVAKAEAYDALVDERVRLPQPALRSAGFRGAEVKRLEAAKEELAAIAAKPPQISVIIPVYNIGAYLEQCMDTVVRQTFADMEILLINDGSADDSPERCRAWARKDPRIRYIDKENEGVAASRNLGVRSARGKYIAFVDPDDWLELTYMEKLRNALEESGGSFAECDLWRYNNRSGSKIYRSCGALMGTPYTLREHMKYGPTATYKSMSRRDLWVTHQIRMPSCSYESPAIYALVVALAGSVQRVPEALYYYRRFREQSLVETGYARADGTPDPRLGIEAMQYLIHEFKRCGLYREYEDTLEGVVKYRLGDILAAQFHRRKPEDFRLLVNNCRAFLGEAFPEGRNAPYLTWGGYNLGRVLSHMEWLHDPYGRFVFSSLISIASGDDRDHRTGREPFRHRNQYRQIMLERERTYAFWEILRELRPAYLIMDLMEERFDILDTGDRCLTKSDAWDGRDGADPSGDGQEHRIIPRRSEECASLWKKAAETFVQRMREEIPDLRVVIVENYLCERIGDPETRRPFEELEEIRQINRVLEGYYRYLESLLPDAVVVSPAADEMYFTDEKYEYGAVPSHLNALMNRRIAEMIGRALDEEEEAR